MNKPKILRKPCLLVPKTIHLEYPLFVYLPGMDGSGKLLGTQTDGLEAALDVRCLAIPRNDITSWDELASSVLFERIILLNPASSFRSHPLFFWGSQFTDLDPIFLYDTGALGLLPFLASLPRINRGARQELLKAMRSVPPETLRWRISLLREFYIDEYKLSQLTQPILLIAGANDRLLPSTTEALRLANIFPNSRIVVLPESGHACLLEKDINLYEIMLQNDFLECDDQTTKFIA